MKAILILLIIFQSVFALSSNKNSLLELEIRTQRLMHQRAKKEAFRVLEKVKEKVLLDFRHFLQTQLKVEIGAEHDQSQINELIYDKIQSGAITPNQVMFQTNILDHLGLT